jgi:hypothetical protein
MKNLFSRKRSVNSTADIERELESLRARRADLTERVTVAQAEVEAATIARREHLVTGDITDDEASRAAAQRVFAAEAQAWSLQDAIAGIDRQVAEAEAKLAAERDRLARVANVRDQKSRADHLDEVLPPFRDAIAALLPPLAAVMAVLRHADQNFVPNVRALLGEIALAVEMQVAELRAQAERIEQGDEPTIHAPAPPIEVAAPIQVDRKPVFLLVDSKWVDVDGLRTAGRHREVHVPAPVAEAAILHGHGFDPTTADGADRAMKLAHWRSPDYCAHHPSACVDLASPRTPQEESESVAPVIHSEFIGEAQSGVAQVGR